MGKKGAKIPSTQEEGRDNDSSLSEVYMTKS